MKLCSVTTTAGLFLLRNNGLSAFASATAPRANERNDNNSQQAIAEEDEAMWMRSLFDTLSSLPPTEAPTISPGGVCTCPTPAPSVASTCPPNLGDCISEGTGPGAIGTYPTIQESAIPLGRDDSISLLVGGSFFGKNGAEIEGKIVTIGDFNILADSGFNSLVRAGRGSQVYPNEGVDALIVGGDIVVDTTVAITVPGDGVNVVYRGGNIGTGLVDNNGEVVRDGSLSMAKYRDILADLKAKSQFWFDLPANGQFIKRGDHPTGNRVEFVAGDNDCLQVYTVSSDDLNFQDFGTLVQFDENLAGRTIVINVLSNNGIATVANLANFIDPFGTGVFDFDSDTTANILWNFYDADEVILGDGLDGNGQFQGTLLIPCGNLTFTMPGHSGRIIVKGDVHQDRPGSELHNYEFDPSCPLPLPEVCPDLLPTAAPSGTPSMAPTTTFASEGVCLIKTEDVADTADSVVDEDDIWNSMLVNELSSLPPTDAPTNQPTPTVAGMCVCPAPNGSTTCPPNLGDCFSQGTGPGSVATYPTITATELPLGRDDSVSLLVGGNFVGKRGSEIEGKIVTLGDFVLEAASGFNSLVKAGFGSQIIPNDGEDVVIVGNDLKVDTDILVMLIGSGGNIVHGGTNVGTGTITTLGDISSNPLLDVSKYELALTQLKAQSEYWASLPANGVFVRRDDHPTGNRVEFLAGDDDCLQVYNIPSDDLNFRDFGTLVQVDSTLACRTIIINVRSNNGIATIANLANFIDPFGNGGFDFASDVTANILWNFYDADEVILGDGLSGNGQFQGSVLVPCGSLTTSMPGISGRVIVRGDVHQDWPGSELHNYEFDPNCPLPQPTVCPEEPDFDGGRRQLQLSLPSKADRPDGTVLLRKRLRG